MPKPRMPGLRARIATPVILILLLWSVIAVVNLVLASIDNFHSIRTVVGSMTALCGVPLGLLLQAFTWRFRRGSPRLAWAAIAVLVAISGTALWIVNTALQARAFNHVQIGTWPTSNWLVKTRMNWMDFTSLFVLQVLVLSLFESMHKLQTRERQLLEARLATLRFQLNPHFLFNTLNAISTLVAESAVAEAGAMIGRLSAFLRASLEGEPTDMVSLAAELDMISAYLDIEMVRFSDRLEVRYACEAGLAGAQVPSFILQPLVENSVKYAVARGPQLVTIVIRASTVEGNLILIVEDDGCHKPSAVVAGTGVGLRNVAARLDALYGSAANVEAICHERGFTNTVRLPLQKEAV